MTRATRRVPRVRANRNDEVQNQIKQLILQRGLAAGDPMPTEFDLMEELEVSRNSLREALKALQAVGIIEIRRGFGMYVGHRSLTALVDELTFHGRMSLQSGADGRSDLSHLVQLREVLERSLIVEVIQQAGPDDLTELGEVMAAMRSEAGQGLVSADTDRRFHEVLYRPLGNPLITQLLSAFWETEHELTPELGPISEPAESVADRHQEVYQAVLDRDAGAAAAAMSRHFDGIRSRLSPTGTAGA